MAYAVDLLACRTLSGVRTIVRWLRSRRPRYPATEERNTMSKLEDIRTGSRILGVTGDRPVTAVAVERCGTYALALAHKTEGSQLGSVMLCRDMEPDLSLARYNQWTFGADADQLKLVSEAHRISLAYRLFAIADKKGWHQEAFACNSLVVTWRGIVSCAAQLQRETPVQATLDLDA